MPILNRIFECVCSPTGVIIELKPLSLACKPGCLVVVRKYPWMNQRVIRASEEVISGFPINCRDTADHRRRPLVVTLREALNFAHVAVLAADTIFGRR